MDPSLLPKLPGYSFRDPTKTNFRKQHIFDVKAESQAEVPVFFQENVDSSVVNALRTGPAKEAYQRPDRPITPKNKAIPREPPAWLKYDRQCLRFYAFFQEAVHENPTENFRVRKCIIQHFLEDETTYVTEPKIENSGIPQGVFIKRHRVPKSEDGHYIWSDFGLGVNVNFYTRFFRIVDCDEFTRSYYAEQGVDVGVPEDYPGDTFGTTRMMVNFKKPPPDTMEVKEYNEVKLGGGHPNRNLKSFIENDRKTLSFDVMWNDTSYDGGLKHYKLNFFLSDSTMEIKELRQVNTGNETFPMMLKRMKVPKTPILAPCPGLSMRDPEFYTAEDLLIGNTITVYGKELLLYSCDPFTKRWYQEVMNYEQKDMTVSKPKPYVPPNPIPPYNGYGIEEDTMGNVLKLQPNPPKADMYKMFDNDQHVLRFEAKLVSSSQEDDIRRFILSFYPSNDTIQVFEANERNSGIVGGKFLERRKFKNPYTGNYYQDIDCVIGNTIVLQDFRLLLTKCDEYTYGYMEDRPGKYPQADYQTILRKIMSYAKVYQSPQHFLVNLLSRIDPAMGKVIQYKHFLDAIESLGLRLTYQEEASLLRKWDQGGFNINMEAAYEELLSVS